MDANKAKMELLKEFVETCDLLNNGKIDVDYLGTDIDSYSINQTTASIILALYQDSSSDRQIAFDFTVVAPFSKLENLQNSKFCEDFMRWVEEQNNKGNLPKIKGAETIECTAPGRILQRSETNATYVIPMRFTYHQEKK